MDVPVGVFITILMVLSVIVVSNTPPLSVVWVHGPSRFNTEEIGPFSGGLYCPASGTGELSTVGDPVVALMRNKPPKNIPAMTRSAAAMVPRVRRVRRDMVFPFVVLAQNIEEVIVQRKLSVKQLIVLLPLRVGVSPTHSCLGILSDLFSSL